MTVLIVSATQSALRFSLRDGKRVAARGHFGRLGMTNAYLEITTGGETYSESVRHTAHRQALRSLIDRLHRNSHIERLLDIDTVIHRMPHGGLAFRETTLLGHDALHKLERIAHLSPHLPAAINALHGALNQLPSAQHVGVFDNAFTSTLPPEASLYALPPIVTSRFKLRRYGADGILHRQAHREAALLLPRQRTTGRAVSVVIGDDVSVVGMIDGVARETTTGFTLAEGLPGLHRSGSIDPRIPLYIATHLRIDARQVDKLLSSRSGLAAMSGKRSYEEIVEGAHASDPLCVEALMLLSYRVAQAIAGMVAMLGGIDTIIFSGSGVSWVVREEVCRRLSAFGVSLGKSRSPVGVLSSPRSRVLVLGVTVSEDDALLSEAQELLGTRELPETPRKPSRKKPKKHHKKKK